MQWMKRVRGALGWCLVWGAAGVGVGGTIELIDNVAPGLLPFAPNVDMWPQTLGVLFFPGGVLFAALLWIAEGRRRLDELSLPRFTAWGAIAGLLLGLLFAARGVPSLFITLSTLGGAAAAALSLLIVRIAVGREQGGGAEPLAEPLAVEGAGYAAGLPHPAAGQPRELRGEEPLRGERP